MKIIMPTLPPTLTKTRLFRCVLTYRRETTEKHDPTPEAVRDHLRSLPTPTGCVLDEATVYPGWTEYRPGRT